MVDLDELRREIILAVSQSKSPREFLRDRRLRELYEQIKSLPPVERGPFGKRINELKQAIEQAIDVRLEELEKVDLKPIDVTAPMDVNSPKPELLPSEQGTIHPLSAEIERISEIFNRMGFVTEESREIDDQFHMFESLNFPKGHPARDDYDTFMTEETDSNGDRLIAPAHTSTMQNRVLMKYRDNLEKGEAIAAIVPDRVFRNEDLDARHEHTFYQVGKKLDVRVNPFYFPFTEPSFEFALSCPFCEGKNPDCKVCSGEGWIELLGCGMIHPNVLRAAQIDPNEYTGFAFGCGIDRLVMMKYGIEDVRHFESGKLDFLEQF